MVDDVRVTMVIITIRAASDNQMIPFGAWYDVRVTASDNNGTDTSRTRVFADARPFARDYHIRPVRVRQR